MQARHLLDRPVGFAYAPPTPSSPNNYLLHYMKAAHQPATVFGRLFPHALPLVDIMSGGQTGNPPSLWLSQVLKLNHAVRLDIEGRHFDGLRQLRQRPLLNRCPAIDNGGAFVELHPELFEQTFNAVPLKV